MRPPTRRTPASRSVPPPAWTTAASWSGCNVENAAYGVGLCAECGLVSAAARQRRRAAHHAVCVNGEGEVLMPCGRCRQLLYENGGPELLLWTVSGIRRMDEVLPDAFGPDDLA